ncbi:hypothetical protein TSUD_227480 [Trifolium subterraneum]|uniref:Uncharacterized protein n=1 Tax=Trifolium subterraneum TaxID=3900 RepID=A0A2Z6M9R4_TRISU|nr:hypothetical protein TSUD_227480 [Trifolium subterraneum]
MENGCTSQSCKYEGKCKKGLTLTNEVKLNETPQKSIGFIHLEPQYGKVSHTRPSPYGLRFRVKAKKSTGS